MSGTRGSSGLGSVSIEQIERRTVGRSAHTCTSVRKRLTFRYRQRGRPLVPQDIKADGTIGVDIGVIDLGREADFGRLEGVIDWERDGEEEDPASIRRLPLVAA